MQQLIVSATNVVLAEGLGDMSLRSIAARIGTSHRMLIYYFKSADAFWEMVLREIRHREQASRRDLAAEQQGMAANTEKAWERFSSENYISIIQLQFELYPKAIRDREKYKEFLDDVVSTWLVSLELQFIRELGLDPSEAAVRARIHLATIRGLLLDFLVTQDRKQTTSALKYFANLITLPSLTVPDSKQPQP